MNFLDIKPLPPTPEEMARQRKWDFRMLSMARLVSMWSQDPSTRVGAVITRRDHTVLSLGYNGFPRGCSDAPELYEDRERKYARVVHAELNAILAAAERPIGCTLYVWPPALRPGTCANCASAIIQSGISRVVSVESNAIGFNERWEKSYREAAQMYAEALIPFDSYPLAEFEEWMKAMSAPPFSAP